MRLRRTSSSAAMRSRYTGSSSPLSTNSSPSNRTLVTPMRPVSRKRPASGRRSQALVHLADQPGDALGDRLAVLLELAALGLQARVFGLQLVDLGLEAGDLVTLLLGVVRERGDFPLVGRNLL